MTNYEVEGEFIKLKIKKDEKKRQAPCSSWNGVETLLFYRYRCILFNHFNLLFKTKSNELRLKTAKHKEKSVCKQQKLANSL